MQAPSAPAKVGTDRPDLFATKTRFCGYAVRFSPYKSGLVAVGTAQYFGIVGNGRLEVLRAHTNPNEDTPNSAIHLNRFENVNSFDTNQAVFDCAWSEGNEDILATATGDGAVRLWSMAAKGDSSSPIALFAGHSRDCTSIDWNIHIPTVFISGSWDGTVMLWDTASQSPGKPSRVVHFPSTAHINEPQLIYSAIWAPANAHVVAVACADGRIRINDMRQTGPPVIAANPGGHVLSVDWNKYRSNQIIAGSSNGEVSAWDIRKTSSRPLLTSFPSHSMAVRRIRCNPHNGRYVATASYDMTVRVWDLLAAYGDKMTQCAVGDHHREFVCGLDWSLFQENLLCSASWDKTVLMWNPFYLPQGPPPQLWSAISRDVRDQGWREMVYG